MSNSKLMLIGASLIAAGMLPTPDDVTVISPVLQIGLGMILFTVGIFKKE